MALKISKKPNESRWNIDLEKHRPNGLIGYIQKIKTLPTKYLVYGFRDSRRVAWPEGRGVLLLNKSGSLGEAKKYVRENLTTQEKFIEAMSIAQCKEILEMMK